jgi:hypothetical protein
MSNENTPQENLAEEFRNLGRNFSNALQAAWESPERKRLQEEITTGMNELGETLSREAKKFNESDAGKQLKTEAKEFEERFRSGEVQDKVRQELITAMQSVNAELGKLIQKWQSPPPETPAQPPADQNE